MDLGDKKVLAFLLCRSGCVPYATQMVIHLRGVKVKTYASAFSTEALPKDSYRIPTYRNIFEFLLSSFIILPWLMIRVVLDIHRGFRIGYFPMFHPWNPFLILIFRLWRKKCLVTAHEGRLHRGEAYSWEQGLANLSIKWADGLVFLTEKERSATQKYLPFRGRSWVIPHGILQLPGLRTTPRTLPDRPALLFLGRIVLYKGLELLLHAVSLLPREAFHHLTIAGRANYMASGQSAMSQVRWIKGWLSEAQMAQLLNEHDILILPYLEASQSGIATLGIAAAIPMICTRVGGLTEQLSEEEAIWAEPNPDSLLAAIKRLISDPDCYGQLHQRLAQKRGNEGWAENARKIEGIFKEL